MRNNKIVITVLFLILMSVSSAHGRDDGSWQFWNLESFEKSLTNKDKLIVDQEFRWGNDIKDFIYYATDVGFSRKFTHWLDASANFRYIRSENADEWEREYRPHINATASYSWQSLDLSNRSRLEYRSLGETKDTWRYRNLSEVIYAVDWGTFDVSPFLKEEAFVDFDQDDFNENRLSVGVLFYPLKNLNAEIYYMLQHLETRGDWRYNDVIGTKIKITF